MVFERYDGTAKALHESPLMFARFMTSEFQLHLRQGFGCRRRAVRLAGGGKAPAAVLKSLAAAARARGVSADLIRHL
jgi:hypothetical protein